MIFIFLNEPDINNTNLGIINYKKTQTCLHLLREATVEQGR
jgi:hypothetical protein